MMISLKFLLCCLLVSSCAYATIVSHDGRAITIDGHRRVLFSGSIHYPRSTTEVTYISTYIYLSGSFIMFSNIVSKRIKFLLLLHFHV